MICWHSRYNLGDKHNYSDPTEFIRGMASDLDDTFDEWVDYQENTVWNDLVDHGHSVDSANKFIDKRIEARAEDIILANCVMLPVFMYEHSGVALNTGGFGCPWDSGQVGYIYLENCDIRTEFNGDREAAERALEMEVAFYGEYVNGDCYGYVVEDDNGEVVDSCCGFIGADPYTNGIREAVIEGGNSYDELIEDVEYAQ
jgi:hypothetical protein